MSHPVAYDCREAFRRLDDFVDRELTGEEMRLVREHLQACAVCAREFAFERSVIDQVRDKLRRLDVPPDLMQRIARQLAAARENDDAP
jgi:anti-sigma factor (TIGR02949 family)